MDVDDFVPRAPLVLFGETQQHPMLDQLLQSAFQLAHTVVTASAVQQAAISRRSAEKETL